MNEFLRYYFGAIGLASGIFLLWAPASKTRGLMLTLPPKVMGAF